MSTNIKKSLRLTEFGPPSVLRIEEVAIPEPDEGDALVHVEGAAINPRDIGKSLLQKATIPKMQRSGAVQRCSAASVVDLARDRLAQQKRRRSNRGR